MTDIVLKDIRKSFADKIVFDGFSAVFPAGEVSGLMGPSGGGKTTLLRLILGLEIPDGGTVSGVPERKAAVFQEDRLCPGVSPVENVLLVTGRSREAEARSLLTELGLGDSLDLPCVSLSGGMRRRAAIARALLADGELLTLDEPFKGLDEENRRIATGLVLRHRRGRTLLYVTHEREEAALLGGKVWHIP